MNIPLEPGDEVVSVGHSPAYGSNPILLVVTKYGRFYEVKWDPDQGYTVHVL
jgi:hypothetical protein